MAVLLHHVGYFRVANKVLPIRNSMVRATFIFDLSAWKQGVLQMRERI